MSNSNLTGADLSNMNFRKARFDDSNLSGADMSLSNFQEAKFVRSDLSEVTASNSSFVGAFFDGTKLASMGFEGADVDEAVFINSPITPQQTEVIGRGEVRTYESRASYQNSMVTQLKPNQVEARGRSFVPDSRTRKNRYDVFFGTDRKPAIERDELVGFTGEREGALSYGVCEVIVPDGHQIGRLGSPLWRRLWNRHDDRLRLENVIGLNHTLFIEHVRQSLEKMKVTERPTMFVHGFKNSFEDAVLRAAQIGYDLGLGQGIGLYSWPSKGEKRAYTADEATIESSKYQLAAFIEVFSEASTVGPINIIAHSMGCRCLLGAFEVLAGQQSKALSNIHQTILAAADVDVDAMDRLGLHAIKGSARLTSYASDKDRALMISEWLHSYPRVGVLPPTYVLNGMDTVIVNNLDLGGFSHGYVGTSRVILNDMFSLLKDNSPPDQRFSVERSIVDGVNCWRLKE